MIVDPAETYIIASVGPADAQSVWSYEVASGQAQRILMTDDGWIEPWAGTGNLFAVVHRTQGARVALSARLINSPSDVISRITSVGEKWMFEGDVSAWDSLPHAYTDHRHLYLLDMHRQMVQRQVLSWYDASYDKGYQGIVAVTQVPSHDLLIISIQRDSEPVLYDPRNGRAMGKIRLAGRRGNPRLRFCKKGAELWASDYDTLVRLTSLDWSIFGVLHLQGEAVTEVAGLSVPKRQFIGEFALNRDETVCAVARPYSGDVLLVDAQHFRVTHRVVTGREPFDVTVLSDGRVIARDWKSGDLLINDQQQEFELG